MSALNIWLATWVHFSLFDITCHLDVEEQKFLEIFAFRTKSSTLLSFPVWRSKEWKFLGAKVSWCCFLEQKYMGTNSSTVEHVYSVHWYANQSCIAIVF